VLGKARIHTYVRNLAMISNANLTWLSALDVFRRPDSVGNGIKLPEVNLTTASSGFKRHFMMASLLRLNFLAVHIGACILVLIGVHDYDDDGPRLN